MRKLFKKCFEKVFCQILMTINSYMSSYLWPSFKRFLLLCGLVLKDFLIKFKMIAPGKLKMVVLYHFAMTNGKIMGLLVN